MTLSNQNYPRRWVKTMSHYCAGHRLKRALLWMVPLLVLLGSSGCNYSHGEAGYHWSGLHRQDIQSVAVPIFTNKTFERGVEFRLSQALVQRIESATPYKVMDRRQADTVLEGEIVRIGADPIGIDRYTANPQEQLYTIVVNFTWKNLRTGEILRQQERFEQTGPYYPTLGEGSFAGSQDAVEKLAVAIVQQLESDW